jgi:hypothetical protein
MTIHSTRETCSFSRRAGDRARVAAMLLAVPLAATACVLTGVEPDEIDLISGETGSATTGNTGVTGYEETGGEGDGDGDPGSGDGDGDPDQTTGDGDGDPATTSGDGDGDPSGGDLACDEFDPQPVTDGDNDAVVGDGVSMLMGTCGADGPERVYVYTATADGVVSFALVNATFEGVVYIVGDSCDPLDELACQPAPEPVQVDLGVGDTVYVVVDSFGIGGGIGILQIN